MKPWAVVLLVLSGCAFDLRPPEESLRGFTREELEAGPTDRQMHAAILNDVRRWRGLEHHLDDGVPACSAFKPDGVRTICVADETEISIFQLRSDLQDQPYRVDETAYYCSKEGVYYYHYVGGPRRLDVWLGPYKIDRPPRKLDDYK